MDKVVVGDAYNFRVAFVINALVDEVQELKKQVEELKRFSTGDRFGGLAIRDSLGESD